MLAYEFEINVKTTFVYIGLFYLSSVDDRWISKIIMKNKKVYF